MKKISLGTILLFFDILVVAQSFDLVDNFKKATPKQLDTFNLYECNIEDYIILTEYAQELLKSGVDTLEFKGEVSLSIISKSFCEKINTEKIKKDKRAKDLFLTFESYQYYCNQKPSDYLKLAHHLCEGNYSYVYSRAQVSAAFIPVITLTIIILILFVLNILGIIKWKIKKYFNVIFLGIIIFLFLIFVVFKLTCNQYVTSDSFYFISF